MMLKPSHARSFVVALHGVTIAKQFGSGGATTSVVHDTSAVAVESQLELRSTRRIATCKRCSCTRNAGCGEAVSRGTRAVVVEVVPVRLVDSFGSEFRNGGSLSL